MNTEPQKVLFSDLGYTPKQMQELSEYQPDPNLIINGRVGVLKIIDKTKSTQK